MYGLLLGELSDVLVVKFAGTLHVGIYLGGAQPHVTGFPFYFSHDYSPYTSNLAASHTHSEWALSSGRYHISIGG